MNGEFTAACANYYRLNQKLSEEEEEEAYFQNLLQNAIPHTGQTKLAELDQVIACNRKVQQTRDDVDQVQQQLREAEALIMKMMQYFEMPPNTILTGIVPGEMEFEIWADEQDTLHCHKTIDLDPPIEGPNIITIKFCNERRRREEAD